MIKPRQKLIAFSWAMYDFANTIFAMNVISLYFALWVTVDMGGEDILYGWALSGSMLAVALASPVAGAVSDRMGKRMPFLIFFTLICCVFTAAIGLTGTLLWGLLFFAAANFCYQIAFVFYNSLLPQISPGEMVGRISGYGVGLGYCGTIAGLLLVRPFVLKMGRRAAFIPTACFFLLFALPCFFFVRDRLAAKKAEFDFELIKGAFRKIKNTFLHIKNYPGLLDFLLAAFIALNAINTIIVFMSVFTKKVVRFSDAEMITFYVVSAVFAIAGSFTAGFTADRLGAKKTLQGVLGIWCLSILLAMFAFNKAVFWVVGPLVGISLGATWTAARALIVDLSPPHMVGEIFGFFSLAGRSASIAGPLIWGFCVWGFGFLGMAKYRLAASILLLLLGSGYLLLCRVPERKSAGAWKTQSQTRI